MIPLYRYSAETAKNDGELDTWRESKKENIRCRDFLDDQIAKRFDGLTLPSDCVKNTVKEFGYDRTIVGGKRFAYSLSRTLFRTVRATEDFTAKILNGQSALIFPIPAKTMNLQ